MIIPSTVTIVMTVCFFVSARPHGFALSAELVSLFFFSDCCSNVTISARRMI